MVVAGALALAACGSDNRTAAARRPVRAGGARPRRCPAPSTAKGRPRRRTRSTRPRRRSRRTIRTPRSAYNATGSGAGIKSFNGKQVDWAGSDSALKTDPGTGGAPSETDAAKQRCGGNDAWNIPLVAGPISVAYNLKGVEQLVLTPSVIAQIFNGRITQWNDPAIAKLNSGVTLPSQKISVFYRSDESGTTENREVPGRRRAAGLHRHPVQDLVGQDRPGCRQVLGRGPGHQEHPGRDRLRRVVERQGQQPRGRPGGQRGRTRDALRRVGRQGRGGRPARGPGQRPAPEARLRDKTPGVYPIVLVTYEIVCSKGNDAAKLPLLKAFLSYLAQPSTQQDLAGIGYATLPASVLTKVDTAVNALS